MHWPARFFPALVALVASLASVGCVSSPAPEELREAALSPSPDVDLALDDAAAPRPGDAMPVFPDGAIAGTDRKTVFGGSRAVTLQVPGDYEANHPAPLVLFLHGYAQSADYAQPYLRMAAIAEQEGIFALAPEGTRDGAGRAYWNATDACCDFADSQVDDVAYLSSLVQEVQAEYAIDPARIWVAGHSNGAFMALALACARADLFAAVISLAGAAFPDAARCAPTEPVSILHIHGTEDGTVRFEGGDLQQADGSRVPYPGAIETVAQWAGHDGCGPERKPGGMLDVDAFVRGTETAVTRHVGCPSGIDAELWRVREGEHLLTFTTEIAPTALLRWLREHPKATRD